VTGRAELREGAGATGASVPAQPDVPAQYGGSTQGETIEVQSGDTLYAIARRYNVSVTELKSANGLSSDSVYAGQRLTLPIR
jgi:LysM repeat protein